METRRKLGFVVTVCVLMACPSAVATAKIIYVDDGATKAGNGSSWASALKYLQEALTVAGQGDEIRVARGIYCPDRAEILTAPEPRPRGSTQGGGTLVPGPQSLAFRLKTGVALKGGFAGLGAQDPNERDVPRYETILSGDLKGNDENKTGLWSPLLNGFVLSDNSKHIVTNAQTDATAVLDGFTITGATEAGILNDLGSPTMTNCTFRRNSTEADGGALRSTGGHPTLSHCTFRENSSLSRGGAIHADGGALTLVECHFVANAAYVEGGAVSNRCALDMTDCVFEQNVAQTGGAVIQRYNTLDMTGCRFEGNLASMGGALYQADSLKTWAAKCVFKGNWAQSTGGAVYVNGGSRLPQAPVTFEGCTFTGNSAVSAGALFVSDLSVSQRGLLLSNCLLTGNRAQGTGGVIYASSSRQTITNCTFADNWAGAGATLSWTGYRWVLSDNPAIMMTNCILWDRDGLIFLPSTQSAAKPIATSDKLITVAYSDVRGTWYGQGNIEADPLFAGPGFWVDASNPKVSVGPDHPQATWVEGDYHLKAQAGRWDPVKEGWVQDDVTSPCIDAGHPGSLFADEPEPNGGRINMGAYGGTVEASKSYQTPPTSAPSIRR